MFSYTDLKRILYVLQTALGAGMILLSNNWWTSASATANLFDQLAALGLFGAGLMCIVFGIMTYLFRQDPDIWR